MIAARLAGSGVAMGIGFPLSCAGVARQYRKNGFDAQRSRKMPGSGPARQRFARARRADDQVVSTIR